MKKFDKKGKSKERQNQEALTCNTLYGTYGGDFCGTRAFHRQAFHVFSADFLTVREARRE
jgi:hypothetical protein